MARLEIIDFSPDYSAAFAQLNREWLEKYFRVEPIDDTVLSDPAATIVAHGGVILFAKTDDEIVGTAALKHHGDGNFELTKMAVTADRQGTGIGRALLSAVIARYEAIGGARLYLESHSSLLPALRLYESAGFVHAAAPAPSEYQRADVYMVYRPD